MVLQITTTGSTEATNNDSNELPPECNGFEIIDIDASVLTETFSYKWYESFTV